MLRSAKELTGYVLDAEDHPGLGRCHDFLFDDSTWTIRYMVADTRKWLPGRKVLVSPIALGDPDWLARRFPVKMTRSRIESAPELDEHQPVTRQYERWYHEHFGWPLYWGGAELWADATHPAALAGATVDPRTPEADEPQEPQLDEPHLHSLETVLGHRIEAQDGEIGKVDDFIVDDATWNLRHAVVDTRAWLPGKLVLVPLSRLEGVNWQRHTFAVDLTRERVRDCPPYDPAAPVNEEHEKRLYDYLGRPTRPR